MLRVVEHKAKSVKDALILRNPFIVLSKLVICRIKNGEKTIAKEVICFRL